MNDLKIIDVEAKKILNELTENTYDFHANKFKDRKILNYLDSKNFIKLTFFTTGTASVFETDLNRPLSSVKLTSKGKRIGKNL